MAITVLTSDKCSMAILDPKDFIDFLEASLGHDVVPVMREHFMTPEQAIESLNDGLEDWAEDYMNELRDVAFNRKREYMSRIEDILTSIPQEAPYVSKRRIKEVISSISEVLEQWENDDF